MTEQDSPPFRVFRFSAVVSSKASAEVIALLSQVMESYKDLPEHERSGVVLWFSQTYGAPAQTIKE